VNEYGEGPWSTSYTKSTLPTAPTLGVAGVADPEMIWRTSITGCCQVGFSWDEATPNGYPVTGYQVSLSHSGGGSYGDSSTYVETGMTRSWTTASNLSPYSLYRLRVRAKSDEMGWGDWQTGPWEYSTTGVYTRDYPGVPAAPTLKADYGDFSNITTIYIEWPAPDARYLGTSALRYKVEINGDDATPISDAGTSRELTVLNLPPQTSRTFRVKAQNDLGWGEWSSPAVTFTTAAAIPPEAPDAPARAALSGGLSNVTAIAVEWPVPSSVGSPIVRYHVTYDNVLQSAVTTPRFERQDLAAGSQHSFSVVAENDAGLFSPPSELSTLSLEPGKKPDPPDAPSVHAHPSATNPDGSSNATSILLLLTKPNFHGQAVDQIEVRVNGGAVTTKVIVSIPSSGSFTTLLPRDSCPPDAANPPCFSHDTEYTFDFRARNAEGWSDYSPSLTASTEYGRVPRKCDPLEADTLPGTISSITHVGMKWTRPGSDAPISGYTIYRDGSAYKVISGGSAVNTFVTGDPQTTWSFQLMAHSELGDSPLSDAVSFTTDAPIAPLPPVLEEGELPNNGFIFPASNVKLVWEKPSTYEETGAEISSYSVLRCDPCTDSWCYQNDGSPTATYCWESTGVTETQRMFWGMQRNTTYLFRAKSFSSAGESDWSSPFFNVTTGPGQVPDVPSGPTMGTADNNATQIKLVWGESVDYGVEIIRYEVSIDGGAWFSAGDKTTFTYLALDLTPSTDYSFRVRAVNELGPSETTSSETFSTTAGQPPEPTFQLWLGATPAGKSNITSFSLFWVSPESDIVPYNYQVRAPPPTPPPPPPPPSHADQIIMITDLLPEHCMGAARTLTHPSRVTTTGPCQLHHRRDRMEGRRVGHIIPVRVCLPRQRHLHPGPSPVDHRRRPVVRRGPLPGGARAPARGDGDHHAGQLHRRYGSIPPHRH
jgi:hypothetical protein